jgi:hypothetical protein
MPLKIITALAAGAIVFAISVGGATAGTSPANAASKRCQRFPIPSSGGGEPAHDRAVIVSGHVSCSTATKVMETYVGRGTFTPVKVLGYSCTSKTKKISGGGTKVLGQTCRKGTIVLKAVSA